VLRDGLANDGDEKGLLRADRANPGNRKSPAAFRKIVAVARQHKSLSLMKAKDKPAAARLSLSQPMEARPGGSSSQRSRLVVRESLFVVTLTVQCPCRISRAQVQCERP